MGAISGRDLEIAPTTATAVAHPNIALIKYWGKRPGTANIPAAPSLSITLDGLTTRTKVTFDPSFTADVVVRNGKAVDDPRVSTCLDRLRARGRHAGLRARVETANDFPTAAGLASSASGFAALVTAGAAALGLELTAEERSVEARIASASAARSIFGGFVALEGPLWSASPLVVDGSWLKVVIAVCDTSAKSVSSSDGMRRSALTSPYYDRWLSETRLDFELAREASEKRDFERLASIAEGSCLKMHAVMLTSVPALQYWNAATIECMRTVVALRSAGTPVFFTIDAGPQVKAVCLSDSASRVAQALATTPGVTETRTVGLGAGAHTVP